MKCPTIKVSSLTLLFTAGGCLIFMLTACNKNPYPKVSSNALVQRRFEWNYKTLVEPYEKAGHTSPKWNEPARRALTEFARNRSQCTESNEAWGLIISTNCIAAADAGCDDPMIRYLYIRFCMNQTNSSKAFADASCKVAQDLNQSSYPSIRKFYASLRAVQQLYYAFGAKADRSAVQAAGGGIKNYLVDAIRDETMPLEEAYDACSEGIEIYRGAQNLYEEIEKPLFDRWPDKSEIWLLKGEAYIKKAWYARGSGYANTVTEQGWGLFSNHLAVAEESLAHAWKLNPKDARIPLKMLTVELGQGEHRDRMELWFNRAMAIDPNDYDACKSKLNYLEPKWYGSEEDLLVFGWECAGSKEWGGKVPLILSDAHEAIRRYLDKSEQDAYWKRPDVWPDLKEAFEKFFMLNPDATSWYHNYAWYAYHCERWGKLNELIPKLGPINYDYFGGREKYDEMIRLAKEHAGETETETNTLSIEIKRLAMKIAARVHEGKTTETDFARELSGCDAFLAKYKDIQTDDVAQVLFLKAQLYWQVFDDAAKGRQLINQLKQDFPQTKLGRNADQILAVIDNEEAAKKIRNALAVGSIFPDFNEQDLAGKPLSIAGYKGKVVLIDFWATWCGPCVGELPKVIETYQKYHDQGFEIIGISLDEDQQKLESFIKQKKMTWPQFFDGKAWENKLAAKYGIASIPATFLLDGDGKIIGKDLRGEKLDQAVAKAVVKN